MREEVRDPFLALCVAKEERGFVSGKGHVDAAVWT